MPRGCPANKINEEPAFGLQCRGIKTNLHNFLSLPFRNVFTAFKWKTIAIHYT